MTGEDLLRALQKLTPEQRRAPIVGITRASCTFVNSTPAQALPMRRLDVYIAGQEHFHHFDGPDPEVVCSGERYLGVELGL